MIAEQRGDERQTRIESRPAVRDNLVEEVIEQELFLYDRSHGTFHCLNAGAAIIWFLCDGNRRIQDIASEIVAVYDLPQEQVLPEVEETVTQFQALGLLQHSI